MKHNIDLKPCPFCNCEVELVYYDFYPDRNDSKIPYMIFCKKCDIEILFFKKGLGLKHISNHDIAYERIEEIWNKRKF
jgi:hypothetical protein